MRAKTFSRKFMLAISAGTMRLDADINSKCKVTHGNAFSVDNKACQN